MTNPDSRPSVLALNSGSSSLKFGLYRVGPSSSETLLSGEAESIGDKNAKFQVRDSRANALLCDAAPIPSQREAIDRIGRLIAASKMAAPVAVGHRIVHGGPKLRRAANNPSNDPASRCSVLVLASQEDEQIARRTWALLPRSLP